MSAICRDLDKLHPFVKAQAHKVLDDCVKEGLSVGVFETLRTDERQQMLFDQGNSKTLNSYHKLGLAVDFVFLVNGRWSWAQKNDWDKLAEIVERHGFSSGWRWVKWKDGPHAELRFKGVQTKDLYRKLKTLGREGFYHYIDTLIKKDENIPSPETTGAPLNVTDEVPTIKNPVSETWVEVTQVETQSGFLGRIFELLATLLGRIFGRKS